MSYSSIPRLLSISASLLHLVIACSAAAVAAGVAPAEKKLLVEAAPIGEEARSPFYFTQRRSELKAEQTSLRGVAASIEELLRVTNRVASSVASVLQDDLREQKTYRSLVDIWAKEDGAGEDPVKASAALEKIRAAMEAQSALFKNSIAVQYYANFDNWLASEENMLSRFGGLSAVLQYAPESFSREFRKIIADADGRISKELQKISDACFEVRRHLTDTSPPPDDEALKSGMNSCRDIIDTREDVITAYYGILSETAAKLQATIATASETVQGMLAKVTENLNLLDQEEIRADALHRSRSATIIDRSAEGVISKTLIAWTIIILLVIGAALFVVWLQLTRSVAKAGDDVRGFDFNYGIFVDMITIFILTATIMILGLGGKLNSEALAALIGGISGYVLGRMGRANGKDAPS